MIERPNDPATGCVNGLFLSFIIVAAIYILVHIVLWIL